jgi:hypothetical protein
MGKSWKQPLVEIQGKAMYIRPKVVGPFPVPCVSKSYVHGAALYYTAHLRTIADQRVFYRLCL